ncbi:Di-copper centre-containing protein [Serendipita vermifera]|nr:Di-copper centre-containing protein [Serendipita vermifera]
MTIITQGVTSPAPLVARQEIRTFARDKELMELYLLGLERFQKAVQTDPLSWYQIAGIHGRPYVVYDGAAGSTNLGGNFGGYCTHSSTLFPTWHRPYLALFEQTLTKHVTDIANEYQGNDRQRYIAASQRFRVPYWDWAANSDLPDFVSIQAEVVVNSPTGSRRMPNPLYAYAFHPMDSTFGDGTAAERSWESWMATIRWPTRGDSRGVSDTTTLEAILQRNRAAIRLRVYNLLTQSATYEAFSNDGFDGPRTDPRYYDSLEAIHGTIHGLTGNDGHMGDPDFAAFDPVFWLHHANVDRLFALWQALHPDLFVAPRLNFEGTFTTRPGTREGPQSNLTPFWRSSGVFWNSEGARDTRTFNYTYPELAQWSTLPPQEKARRLRTQINDMYGRGSPVDRIRQEFFQPPTTARPAAAMAAKMEAPAAQQPVAAPDATTSNVIASVASVAPAQKPVDAAQKGVELVENTAAGESVLANEKQYTEWIANISVEKFAAKRAFFVHIFLGDFTTDSSKWGQDANLVGTHVVFANNIASTGCERCHENAENHKLVSGTIPLTAALADRLGEDKISKLEPAEIIPYLQRNLHWRIQRYDGTVIERTDMPSLKVAVAHFEASVPESIAQFPTWGEGHKDTSVTVGRPGGAGEDD